MYLRLERCAPRLGPGGGGGGGGGEGGGGRGYSSGGGGLVSGEQVVLQGLHQEEEGPLVPLHPALLLDVVAQELGTEQRQSHLHVCVRVCVLFVCCAMSFVLFFLESNCLCWFNRVVLQIQEMALLSHLR